MYNKENAISIDIITDIHVTIKLYSTDCSTIYIRDTHSNAIEYC